jgi:RNA 2',3'-cyclic 3'-phosphodiesterase
MSQQSDHSFIKAFFALWPSAAERSHLAAWQNPLQSLCGGRAMHGETLHNTLVFIGNIAQSRLEPLQLAAQEVSGEGFKLCFDVARYWGHNHIVYAAPVHLPQPLKQLVLGLEQSLIRHGFKFDSREYQPHVTLMRNAHWTDAPLPAMQPVCWQVNDFALVQSVNHERLAGYRVLARFPLGPLAGDPQSGPDC